jgi:hypothetical protein
MIGIDPRQMNGLEWKQPAAFRRAYELRAGDSVVASLEFVKMLGSLAEGEVAGARWTFKRSGFVSPKATARVAGSEEDIALYEPNWSGRQGLFRLEGGEILDFKATNFWGSEWVLADSRGEQLLRYHTKGVLHTGAGLELSPEVKQRADLPLLLLLTWYVLVLHREDDGAAAAVISG